MAQELDQVLNLYKRKSETPLQTLERYVSRHLHFKKAKMTYAGRLDPMAEGVLVALTGEKNKERDAYTGLDKDYEFEFLLGVETDTHDILGKVVSAEGAGEVAEPAVALALKKYLGKFMQKYPAYSSKVVDGTPLFDLARKGKLESVAMPEHEVTVERIELVGSRKVSKDDFRKSLIADIEKVTGDFRQAEILEAWDRYFESTPVGEFTLYKAKVTCGSGFYVRQLVSDVGRDLGTGAITTSILRTRVGTFKIEDSWRQ